MMDRQISKRLKSRAEKIEFLNVLVAGKRFLDEIAEHGGVSLGNTVTFLLWSRQDLSLIPEEFDQYPGALRFLNRLHFAANDPG